MISESNLHPPPHIPPSLPHPLLQQVEAQQQQQSRLHCEAMQGYLEEVVSLTANLAVPSAAIDHTLSALSAMCSANHKPQLPGLPAAPSLPPL